MLWPWPLIFDFAKRKTSWNVKETWQTQSNMDQIVPVLYLILPTENVDDSVDIVDMVHPHPPFLSSLQTQTPQT